MSKGLKVRSFVAVMVVAGCACAVGFMTTSNHASTAPIPMPSVNATSPTVGAGSKTSDDDQLAARYRRRVRRTVVII
jgi:hypothetical protein